MAIDKQIFQLPDITLEILNSGVDVSFVAQVQGYGLDFQVPLDVMSEYLNSGYQIGITGGGLTPDNAAGKNGDIYFKNDGKLYQKVNGTWVVKYNFPFKAYVNPLKVNIPSGSSYPYTTSIAGTNLEKGFGYYVELILSPTKTRMINDVWIEPTYTDNTRQLISSIDIFGHANGSVTIDDLVVTLYSV